MTSVIRGQFDHRGRPCVQGWLSLPRLNIRGEVEFLVDTGADSTVIHPSDGLKLGLPFGALHSEIVSVGIGGDHRYFLEDAGEGLFHFARHGRYNVAVEMVTEPFATLSETILSLIGGA